MKYVRYTLPLAVAALAALAGCGAAPKASGRAAAPAMTSMPGMATSAAAAEPAPTDPVATDSVAIKNFAFSLAMVTVKVGTTVTWTNGDQDPHTATATSGTFRSPTLNTGPGGGWRRAVAGVIRYTAA